MARLRIGEVSADELAVAPRLRIGGVSADGALPTTGRLRLGGVSADGTLAVTLLPLAPQTVRALTTVTLTAVTAPGSAVPDSYTWRVLPGSAPVTLTAVGNVATFAAAAHKAGTYSLIGVVGVKGGVLSPEQVVRIDSLPHQLWISTTAGTWVPRKVPVFL
jgi:hypothetical protein